MSSLARAILVENFMTIQNLNEIQKEYWNRFIFSLPQRLQPLNPNISASVAGNKEITDELLNLYLTGKKTAGSSLVEDFLSVGDPLPQIGNYWIYLNSKEEPSCILQTVDIKIYKFDEVSVEIAIAEGEGDLSLSYWKKTHENLYRPFLQKWGLNSIHEATVITEFFKIVYR